MKRTLSIAALLSLAACGPTAEDYAGAYVGDQVTHSTIGSNTATSTERILASLRAIDEQTLRLDDVACPLDFKLSEDEATVFTLVPRVCEVENTRTEHTAGKLTVTDDASTVVLETEGKKTSGSIISINSTFTTSFTGSRQP